jgi:hypothetical protein
MQRREPAAPGLCFGFAELVSIGMPTRECQRNQTRHHGADDYEQNPDQLPCHCAALEIIAQSGQSCARPSIERWYRLITANEA